MVSTPSTSLRLELMATGDQSGTWGDTTNTNLGTLLEQAITGVLSVAQGDVATLTLTNTDYVSNQARNAVVNLTGAMTANREVVVPTANKVYLIKNSTTGGFNITVKTAAGTGVTIANGSSQWVYSDGTNVVAGLVGNGVPDSNGNLRANSFVPGYTTTATAAGTTTLTVASTQTQYFTGTTTQTITLPVVSTLAALGQGYDIVNLSTGALTVNSSGGNLVVTIPGGSWARVDAILLTGTTAASWNPSLAVTLTSTQTLTNKTIPNYLAIAGGAAVTGGFTSVNYSGGTVSSGTFTPNPTNQNYQYYTNNGAHTLAAPANDCAIDILITNGASAGSITFSGFTVASGNVGDALTTTNTSKFLISIRRINGVSTYVIKALQ